jgi:hypothetical protein
MGKNQHRHYHVRHQWIMGFGKGIERGPKELIWSQDLVLQKKRRWSHGMENG